MNMPRCSNSSSGSFPHCISDSSAPQKTQNMTSDSVGSLENTTLFTSSQMFSLSPIITCPLTMKRFKNLVAVDTGWLQQQTGAAIYLLSPVNTIFLVTYLTKCSVSNCFGIIPVYPYALDLAKHTTQHLAQHKQIWGNDTKSPMDLDQMMCTRHRAVRVFVASTDVMHMYGQHHFLELYEEVTRDMAITL